jgi:hypothetical protein
METRRLHSHLKVFLESTGSFVLVKYPPAIGRLETGVRVTNQNEVTCTDSGGRPWLPNEKIKGGRVLVGYLDNWGEQVPWKTSYLTRCLKALT